MSQFESIADAREYILEKEIEAILRTSHSEQFKWMEKTFDLPLTKGLNSWCTFIELTERRNLFVHTDGIVSSQHLTVCNQHGCQINEKIKEGICLGVPQKYFDTAYECIHEIGVKLGHVLWRKLFPEERAYADQALGRTTYEMLDNKQYKLTSNLLDFACESIKKFSSEADQLILTVNRALAYKFMGKEEKCLEIMRAVDWTAKSHEFKLADVVLEKKWERAAELMREIGNKGRVTKREYTEWPLFHEWRNEELFLTAYKEIFGEEFAIDTGEFENESTKAPEQSGLIIEGSATVKDEC